MSEQTPPSAPQERRRPTLDQQIAAARQRKDAFLTEAANLNQKDLIARLDSLNQEIGLIRADLYQLTDQNAANKYEQELKNLEQELLQRKYRRIRQLLLKGISDMENQQSQSGEVLHSIISEKLKEEFLYELEKTAREIEGTDKDIFVADSKNCKEEIDARVDLYFHYLAFWNATSGQRDIPAELSATQSLVLTKQDLAWLIRGGLRNPETRPDFFDNETNKIVEKNSQVRWRSLKIFGKVELSPKHDKTEVGHIMRLIDKIYLGQIKVKSPSSVNAIGQNKENSSSDGNTIDVSEIGDTYLDMLAAITDGSADIEADGNREDILSGKAKRKTYDRATVQKAFRLHWCFTLHQSYLNNDKAPRLADYFYYMFRFLDYSVKYVNSSRDTFNPHVTYMIWGMKAAGNYYGEVSKQIVESMKKKLVEVKNALTGKKERVSLADDSEIREKTKFTRNFKWAANLPLFKQESEFLSQNNPNPFWAIIARKDSGTTFAPPLSYFCWKEGNEFVRYPSSITIELDRAGRPVIDPATGNPKEIKVLGKVITFSDFVSAEDDARQYELMPIESMGSNDLNGYMVALKGGPRKFLDKVLKLPADKFMSEYSSPNKWKELSGDIVYIVPFLPRVGNDARDTANFPNHTEMLRKRVLITVLIAYCMTQLENKKGTWVRGGGQESAKGAMQSFLNDLVQEGTIDLEDFEVVMEVAYNPQSWGVNITSAFNQAQAQIKKAFDIR